MHEKVGGQKALLDPALEKVGGQLTPLTPCLRGLDTTVRLRTTRGPTPDYRRSDSRSDSGLREIRLWTTRGPTAEVRLQTTRGPTSDYCASPLVKPGLLRRCLLLDLPCLEQLSV